MFFLRQRRIHPLLLLAACALALPDASAARQTVKPTSTVAPPRASQGTTTAQRVKRRRDSAQAGRASAVTRRRREQAVAALLETAARARSFEDADESARIQMLAADALWSVDADSARAVFRRAWEAATEADRRAAREDSGAASPTVAPPASAGSTEAVIVTEARDEVLSKVAARDSVLAEKFMRELNEERHRHETTRDVNATTAQSAQMRRTPWRELSAAGRRRLELASDLIARREYARAAEIAAPLIQEGASGDLLAFLLRLRDSAPKHADLLYAPLLQRTAADATADANDVSLLSSYIVSPALLSVFDEHGALQFRPVLHLSGAEGATPPPPVETALRASFFKLAANILLRAAPANADGNTTTTTTSAVALYFNISRLLPFLEGEEASAYAAPFNARMNALAEEVGESRRRTLAAQTSQRRLTPENPSDPLRPQLDQITQARDASARDRARLSVVRTAARRRNWERARAVASDIEEADTRRAALSYVAVEQIASLSRAYEDNAEDDYERAAAFVRNADAPPFARAWGMAQAAALAAQRGKRERASEFLDDAARLAASVETNARQRLAAFVAVTKVAAQFDEARAWELLPSVVRAANAVEDASGDDDATLEVVSFATPDGGDESAFEIDAAPFNPDELFATMARLNFPRALELARTLKGDAPRALASIAAARAALDTNAARQAAQPTR